MKQSTHNGKSRSLRIRILLVVFVLFCAACVQALAAGSVLNWGSSGQTVKEVQQKLINWGYMEGSADGIFGAKTYDAVVKFQKNNGLTADGLVGRDTYRALGLMKYAGDAPAQNNSNAGGSGSGGSNNQNQDAVSNSDEVNLLARAIFAESESEPYTGQVAVGAVLLNRVASPDFPNTLSGVIYQGKALESVSNGRFGKSLPDECIRAAQDALSGWDPTYGCLYFWNPAKSVNPWIWTRQIVVQYGNHVFGK